MFALNATCIQCLKIFHQVHTVCFNVNIVQFSFQEGLPFFTGHSTLYLKLYVCLKSVLERETNLIGEEPGNDDGEGVSDDEMDDNEQGDAFEAMEDDYDATEGEPREDNGDDSFMLDDTIADDPADSDVESNCSINT